MTNARSAFNAQKSRAARKKIAFNFTFRSWCLWWSCKLGPSWLEKRGKKKGQYVMIRINDNKPYSISNVKCIKIEKFVKTVQSRKPYGSFHPNAKLTFKDVKTIRTSILSNKELAVRYLVSYNLIWKIRSHVLWTHVR